MSGNPISIVSADFNHDGHEDLAVAQYGRGGLAILLNDGDGRFKVTAMDAEASIACYQLAAGDFNGDGIQDLALPDDGGSLQIYQGKGDGGFGPARVLNVPDRPLSVTSADLNADGMADLVLGNGWGTENVRVLLGAGEGAFRPVQRQSLGFDPRNLEASDFDADGALDLVVTDWVHDRFFLLPGKGDGYFLPGLPVAAGNSPISLTCGDFNGDGNSDCVTANWDGDSISLFLGRGNGTFQPPKEFEAGNLPFFVTAADLNQDQRLDVVVGHEVGSQVDVLLGTGDGSFLAALSLHAGACARSVAIADFNGDGLPDLATANFLGRSVTVLMNTGATINAPVALTRSVGSKPLVPRSEGRPSEARRAAGASPAGDYLVDNWTTDKGLPQNTVQCLLQTRDGYLWVGTQSGLARYDGLRFTVFDRHNTPALKTDNILCLAEGTDHSLWIGTADGLTRLRDHTFTHFGTTSLDPIPTPHVWAVAPSRNGGVWVGAEGLVAKLHGNHFSTLTNIGGRVDSLLEDSSGHLWVAGDTGLFRSGPAASEFSPVYQPALPGALFGARALCSDRNGNFWFGNASGLWRWREGRLKVFRAKHGLSPGIVGSIAQDADGALWMPMGSYLNRFRDGEFTRFDAKSGLPNDEMRCVCPDREGNIWLGTTRSGLVRMRPHPLITYTAQDGLVNDDVWSISESPTGELWMGTSVSVSRLQGETFSTYRLSAADNSEAPPNSKQTVLVDRSGQVWAGGAELAIWKGGGLDYYWRQARPFFREVTSLYQDHSGAVWVGVGCGLWRLDGTQRDLYTGQGWTSLLGPGVLDPRTCGCTIHTVEFGHVVAGTLEDYDGNLWVGTRGGGLYCLCDDRYTTLTVSNGLTSDLVAPLLADPDGTLWVGSDKGLNRLKDGRITRYTTAEGLAENIVGNLLEDDSGWFWTMGHRGIHRMRKRDLTEIAEGMQRRIQTLSYGTADGMLSSEGNVGLFPNACQTSDGLLWFPTTRGVVVVEPHFVGADERPPPVVLEEVRADDEVILGDGRGSNSRGPEPWAPLSPAAGSVGTRPSTLNCSLPPGRARLLEFRYTANTFVAPEQVRFRYQLVGHDPEWREVGLRRSAIYTDLAPGAYRFRVSAVNRHGVESEAPAEFAFSLAPHFYETSWFHAGSAVGLLLSGWGAHRLRLRLEMRRKSLEQQLALAWERERIAKDMHDDLGASLTQIGLLSDHARRQPGALPAVAADLEKIAEATRQTAQAAEEMVWVVSPRHDSLDSLATYLCQLAEEYLGPSGIRCRLDIPPQLPDLRLPSDLRHHLVLFLKEALNNVVKHSGAREVWLALKLTGHLLTVAIIDDGHGFNISQPSSRDPQRASNGNGLLNLRKRAEGMGGQFELKSQPGQGTLVQVVVKLAHAR